MGLLKKKDSTSARSSTSPCADLRNAYHNCFNKWYSEKFVKGQWDKEECVAEWKKYRDCLSENLDGKLLTRILEVDGELNPTKQDADSKESSS
ncbi:Mitochondrial distribution/morphology family 35/apoptosis [Arabidopsis thaliana x Arabidopsis arenosa]|uniref:Uncharacterized protein n=2 Tax=Arabidopsis TaxID=3701 RepID=A0A178UW15_ARATH|nr:Mitochondrial distribution/morphology family 35/apoptosis [Arabidopsis thaliana x Arabidopsis arenosa]OAO97813.1 hypothetical protein AXX17_AT4G37920 [Arabidopsis thaliana]